MVYADIYILQIETFQLKIMYNCKFYGESQADRINLGRGTNEKQDTGLWGNMDIPYDRNWNQVRCGV